VRAMVLALQTQLACLLPMADFNPIIYGRFWVITEA
jgi:hypothetical protein